MKKSLAVLGVLFCFSLFAAGQSQSNSSQASVSRSTKAVNYRLRGNDVKIDFRGTDLMPNAIGEAKVAGKKSNVEIEARFENLDDPTKFGLEYLSLVLWAVSPEGRAVNLGELVFDHNHSRVKAITDMQTFGLIVTAEPYFAVNQPSNMVVMENVIPPGLAQEDIEARYSLLAAGTYSSTNTHIQDAIFGIDHKTPRSLFEARNAVRIARIAGADKYAPSIIARATQELLSAEEAFQHKRDKGSIDTLARGTVETAEEARVMAVKKKAEEEAEAQAAAEKKAAEERAAKEKQAAEDEARRRVEAENERKQAELARQQAEAAKAEALRLQQEAEQARKEAEAARAQAVAQQQALAAEADKARQAAAEADKLRQQAEKEKADLRAQLLAQLNAVLATRDTARGLIANMSDVLFKTGSFELLSGARERLAKVSGIVLAHPGLHLEVDGYTDSVGSDDYNQQLSEHRADAVRDYLVQQGIPDSAVVARGLGKTNPVATNDTAEGRQQNRRVEMVISGDAIGTGSAKTAAAMPDTANPANSGPQQ